MMENVKKILTLFAATLLLLPYMEAQHYAPPRPLCASQFALASYACSLLPYGPMPPIPQPPSPPSPSPPDDDDDDDNDDGRDDDDDNGRDGGGNGGGDGGGDDGGDGDGDGGGDGAARVNSHGHGHSNGHGHGHGREHHEHGHSRKQQRHRRHKHRRGRHHRSQRSMTPQEDNCCKWLTQLDNQCVCELLLRLPTFLHKPAHTYSVYIGTSCNITYTCPHP
ncbi:hypothetical protein ACLB2K_014164 [Fragaria x ananassa]